MPAPLGPLAIAGLTLAGGFIDAGSQSNINRQTQRYNDRMYARMRGDAIDDWNMQNEYNSPAAMMARLKAAGLNPNLAYGQVQNDSGPVRSTDAKAWSPQAPRYGVGDAAVQGMLAYQDIELKQAQADNIKAQTDVARQDELLRAAQILGLTTSTESTRFDLNMKNRLKDVSVQAAELGVQQQMAGIDKTLADTDLSRIGFDRSIADIGATRAGTQVALNRDEREAAANASNLREAVHRILNMQAINAKTEVERQHIKKQIEMLNQSQDIKAYEQSLKEKNIYPGDSYFYRVLEIVISRLRGKSSVVK